MDAARMNVQVDAGLNGGSDAATRLKALERGRSLCTGLAPRLSELADASYKELRDVVLDADGIGSASLKEGLL